MSPREPSPDVEALFAARDIDGLGEALRYCDGSRHPRCVAVRVAAAEALGALRAVEAGQLLHEQLGTDAYAVARAAAIALGKIGISSFELLFDGAEGVSKMRRHAVAGLRQIPAAKLRQALDGKLSDDDGWIREVATRILGDLGASWAVSSLVKTFAADDEATVQAGAAQALGRIRDGSAVPALARALDADDADVRQAAHESLLRFRPFPVADVVPLLKEGGEKARYHAAVAFAEARTTDREARRALVTALMDDSTQVREMAAFALGELEDREATSDLAARLEDEAATVQYAASKALQRIFQANPTLSFDRTPALRAEKTTLARLVAEVEGQDLQRCHDAAVLLGRFREEGAVKALTKQLDDRIKRDVSEQLLEALGRIGSRPALDRLARTLAEDSNWEIRRNAARALGMSGRPGAVPTLVAALTDDDDLVADAANAALERLDEAGALHQYQRDRGAAGSQIAGVWERLGGTPPIDRLLDAIEAENDLETDTGEDHETDSDGGKRDAVLSDAGAKTKKSGFRRYATRLFIAPVAVICGWAILATIVFDFRDPVPSTPAAISVSRVVLELRLDLNEDYFDGDRYDDGDGWFARRVKDLRSMGKVTESEASSAHAILRAREQDNLDFALYHFAGSSAAIVGSHGYIGNYIEALAEYAPEKLDELVGWIAAYVNPEDTGPQLMATITGDARGHLLTAIERLPIDSPTEPNRRLVIERLGGAEAICRRLLSNYFVALLQEDLEAAVAISGHAGRWHRLVPAALPDFIARMGEHDHEKIAELIETYDVGDEEKSVRELHWPGRESNGRFAEFLQRELGLSAAQVEKVLASANPPSAATDRSLAAGRSRRCRAGGAGR